MKEIEEQIRDRIFEENLNIFERKIRNAIKETGGISNETKAVILLSIQDELNEWGGLI